MRKNGFGMTIPELLVVMSIIAILAVLITTFIVTQVFKGNDSRRKTDIYQLQVAVEEYEKDNNCYPTYVSCMENFNDDLNPYLPKIPCDPQTKSDYVYYPDPTSVCPKWYVIYTHLEHPSDPDVKELGCQFGCGPSEALSIFNYYAMSPNAPIPYSNPAPTPQSSNPPAVGLYGCFSGVCTSIGLDYTGQPECSPAFSSSNCFNSCVDPETFAPINECN